LGDGRLFESEKQLKKNIMRLITEAKKRKASEEKEPHFLLFLSEKKKAAYYNLSPSDKEKVLTAMNESSYTTEADVLRIMEQALTTPQKTLEEVLIENIPSDLKPVWESLDTVTQQSILNSAQFYSNLTEDRMGDFWRTRGLDQYVKKETEKKVINENRIVYDNQKLNESQLEMYLDRLKNL
jgi:hypothetical protein